LIADSYDSQVSINYELSTGNYFCGGRTVAKTYG